VTAPLLRCLGIRAWSWWPGRRFLDGLVISNVGVLLMRPLCRHGPIIAVKPLRSSAPIAVIVLGHCSLPSPHGVEPREEEQAVRLEHRQAEPAAKSAVVTRGHRR
jgi:hypothetical protein